MKPLAALLREIDEIRKFVLLDLSIPVLVYLDALRHAHQSGGGAVHNGGLHGGYEGGARARHSQHANVAGSTAHGTRIPVSAGNKSGSKFTTPRTAATTPKTSRTSRSCCDDQADGTVGFINYALEIEEAEYVDILEAAKEFFDKKENRHTEEYVYQSLYSLWEKQTKSAAPESCIQALWLHSVYMEEVLGLVHEKKTLHHVYALLSLSFQSLPLISPTIYELPNLYDALVFCNNLFSSIEVAHQYQASESHASPALTRGHDLRGNLLDGDNSSRSGSPHGTPATEAGNEDEAKASRATALRRAGSSAGSSSSSASPKAAATAAANNKSFLEVQARLQSSVVQFLSHFDQLVRSARSAFDPKLFDGAQMLNNLENIFFSYDYLSRLFVLIHEDGTHDFCPQYKTAVPPWLDSLVQLAVAKNANLNFSCRAIRTYIDTIMRIGRGEHGHADDELIDVLLDSPVKQIV